MSSLSSSTYSLYRHSYPDPFLDHSKASLPKSRKKLFHLLEVFATQNPQVKPIIHRLAKYPITHLIYTDHINHSEAVEDKYKKCLEDDIGIYDATEQIGLDYMGMGCSFITLHVPFERSYKCQHCKNHYPAANVKFKVVGDKLSGDCPGCKKHTSFEIYDSKITSKPEDIKIITIPASEIHINLNELTGEAEYIRDVPKSLRSALKSSKPNRFIIDTTPKVYLESALKKKKIKYSKNSILHLREPSVTSNSEISKYGVPIIMAALSDCYLNQVYKKADMVVANERSVPARFVFPQMTSQDPLRSISLAKWKRFMSSTLKRRRYDKNAIMPVPFPVGVAEVGGDVQRLTTHNIRQLVIDEIINSTGVPRGFLTGQMTYSGGTVAARMLENTLGSYLRALQRFVNFVIEHVRKFTGWPKIKVKWKPFKQADDIQMLQMLMQLLQMNRVSGQEVLDRMNLDQSKEFDKIKKEMEEIQKIEVKQSLTQVKSMIEAGNLQAGQQSEQESVKAIMDQVDDDAINFVENLRMQEDKDDPIIRSILKAMYQMTPQQQGTYLEKMRQNRGENIANQVAYRLSLLDSIRANSRNVSDIAGQIMINSSPKERKMIMGDLRLTDPQLAIRVMHELNQYNASSGSKSRMIGNTTNIKPNPEQKPPRRQ